MWSQKFGVDVRKLWHLDENRRGEEIGDWKLVAGEGRVRLEVYAAEVAVTPASPPAVTRLEAAVSVERKVAVICAMGSEHARKKVLKQGTRVPSLNTGDFASTLSTLCSEEYVCWSKQNYWTYPNPENDRGFCSFSSLCYAPIFQNSSPARRRSIKVVIQRSQCLFFLLYSLRLE
jgi:hypothetical protein